MENSCFVCGVDRFTLDTSGGGFDRHIKEDHNMWAYLYLIIHLREKDPTEYNGWEQTIADRLNAEGGPDASFMPRNDAIALKAVKEREETESKQQAAAISSTAERVERLCATTERLGTAQESMQALLEETAGQVRRLQELPRVP